jgi:3-methyladenine DNA glycosylase AlkC
MGSQKLKRLTERTGARRMAEIPKQVLGALNEGLIETKNLVEILAIDMEKLLALAVDDVGIKKEKAAIMAAFDEIRNEGFNRKLTGCGVLIFEQLASRRNRNGVLKKLSGHKSDTVRSWACIATVMADPDMELKTRIDRAKVFAADGHMAVRENAWAAFRPAVAKELDRGIDLLKPWVTDEDPNIRRCAVEGTRPRGVWTAHIGKLKENPRLCLPLLGPVKSDPSRYVQSAAANWLNDASKTKPDWTRKLCRRWEKESPTKETAYIIKRGLRTLTKY